MLISLLYLTCGATPILATAPDLSNVAPDVQHSIKRRLMHMINFGKKIVINNEPLHAPLNLKKFYEKRSFHPVWVGDKQDFYQSRTLITGIEQADAEGLNPAFYHLETIRDLSHRLEKALDLQLPHSVEQLVDLDLVLTDAFLLLGCHFSAGCVNPVTITAEWHANRGPLDMSVVLGTAIKNRNVEETLSGLLPKTDFYSGLRNALVNYRSIKKRGGWHRVPNGSVLRKGSRGSRVASLKKRLHITGDVKQYKKEKASIIDDSLHQAILKFQKRHGLDSDGLVGSETLQALNTSVEERIRQMEINMERLRWSIAKLEGRQIIVNIADFSLNLYEQGNKVMSMKVVVGDRAWDTPVFMEKMTYLIINPAWNVPDTIARKETIHKIKADPEYISAHNFSVLRGWGKHEKQFDPEDIDWDEYSEELLPYRFRQEPGPLNPLGRIKFMFPNRFSVYLHDTPARHLFNSNSRPFSHGCIRVERPIDLAEYLLMGSEEWPRENIIQAIESKERQEISLPESINVLVLYLTSWVDDEGMLHFRPDIYGRDARLLETMQKGPPASYEESALLVP